MIPGFERELMELDREKVEFTLSPEDAYGERNPDAAASSSGDVWRHIP